jgi:hypothetical protein
VHTSAGTVCDAHEVNERTRISARTPAGVTASRALRLGLAGVLLVAICACTTPVVTGPGPATAAAPARTQAAAISVVSRAATPADGPVEVRLICLSPSPYTHRHDALRAGFGIYLLLQNLILEQRLPIRISYYDGSAFYDDRARVAAVLKGPSVIVVGGSTWSQGPSFEVRRFFELAGGQYLGGVSATAWATAGGAHTGGEEVVSGILRSLMGMGARAFTLGQKYMVFTTDERLDPPVAGAFSTLDLWYMDQFARTIAVVALASSDRAASAKLAGLLGTSPYYFMTNYPPDAAVLRGYSSLQQRLNAAADPNSDAYKQLVALLAAPPPAGAN